MIKEKNCKKYAPQVSLKVVIAVVLAINVLIFTQLLIPSSSGIEKTEWGKPITQKQQSLIRLMYPTLNFLKVVKTFYDNKP
jgi:hypothetical protein